MKIPCENVVRSYYALQVYKRVAERERTMSEYDFENERTDEMVEWLKLGLSIARKENKTLQQMLTEFENAWVIGMIFGFF